MTQTWATFAEVWASIEPFTIGSREYYQIASYIAEVSTKIKIRYLAGVAPYMRVVFGRKEYDILMVIDAAERHKELELMCREVVAGG
jgi:SPP1 family predicted phage head-tail adaptor